MSSLIDNIIAASFCLYLHKSYHFIRPNKFSKNVHLQAGSMQDVRWEPEDLPDDPQNVAPPAFWSPPLGYDGTAEDYYTRRGIPVDQYEEYYNNVIEIKRYFYEENGIPVSKPGRLEPEVNEVILILKMIRVISIISIIAGDH